MLKKNYRKIEKKKYIDMDADVAQCEHSNIKATLQLLVIYRLEQLMQLVESLNLCKNIRVVQTPKLKLRLD